MFRCLVFMLCVIFIDGRFFRNDYVFDANIGGWTKLHRIPANWNEARLRCHLEGGILLSPLSDELLTKMKAVVSEYKFKCGVFTGISAMYSRGDFYSVEGIPMEKIQVPWAPLEPDNFEDKEQCTVILANGTLADVECEEPHPYICFKKNDENMPIPSKCGTVDPEYSYDDHTSHCYKFHRIGQTWPRAFMTCAAEGGYLAIINSAKEAELLKGMFAKYPSNKIMSKYKEEVLIGFRAEKNTNDWMTVDGQTLVEAGYEVWGGGQPDNMTIQSCGGMFRNAQIDDTFCDVPMAFICEKTPGSLLDNENDTTEEISSNNRKK